MHADIIQENNLDTTLDSEDGHLAFVARRLLIVEGTGPTGTGLWPSSDGHPQNDVETTHKAIAAAAAARLAITSRLSQLSVTAVVLTVR